MSFYRSVRPEIWIVFFLTFITVAVYRPVSRHGFVNYDDKQYVHENRMVQKGLTWEGLKWAFQTNHMGNRHPLTWLSHMLDIELYGNDPGRHHLINLVWHVLNAGLLFVVLRLMTGSILQSGLVAVLFAVHPQHVESVAWISERKDVLSAFFFFLSLLAYYHYTRQNSRVWYLLVCSFFLLGLSAKPMLVTLPFVLLLLDIWPLGRIHIPADDAGNDPGPKQGMTLAAGIREKIPLFLITIAACFLTVFSQTTQRAAASLDVFPFSCRLANAALSYLVYIRQMLWPMDLAVFYPFIKDIPLWHSLAAVGVLCLISVFFYSRFHEHPYLLIGWLWYLGTLVPVIGLVQVGSQARADRYTYIPLIGLFIISAWGFPRLFSRWRPPRGFIWVSAGILVTCYSLIAAHQVKTWKNSVTLFQHAIQVTGENVIALNNLGTGLSDQGRYLEAILCFNRVLELDPEYKDGYNNLANAWFHFGDMDKAQSIYAVILKKDSRNAKATYNIGVILEKKGRLDAAVEMYTKAIQVDPEDYMAYNNLGVLVGNRKEFMLADRYLKKAIDLNPDYAEAHYNYGNLLLKLGAYHRAEEQFFQAIQKKADYADAYNNLGVLQQQQGLWKKALWLYQKALAINPDHAQAKKNISQVLSRHSQQLGQY